MKYTTRTTCRVCGSSNLTPLFSLGNQYVSDFVTQDKVYSGPRCPIDIELCGNCTLVQAKHTAPQDFLYSRHYWYRSGVTSTMRDALTDVVAGTTTRVTVDKGDVILDIGSNDGTLLRRAKWCYPHAVTVGVEPAKNMRQYYDDSMYLQDDFWGAEGVAEDFIQCHGQAKIVTALGMFYDLEDPNAFVADVAKVLHPDGVFVAQLMCLKQTIENYDIGNFAHEHLEYYSLKSLGILFDRHGLEVFDIEENTVNGGSYRLYVKHKGIKMDTPEGYQRLLKAHDRELEMGLDKADKYVQFRSCLETMRRNLHAFISDEATKGKRTWVYGASTKGNVILQWAGLDNRLIHGAADRSPEKWGKTTAGTGIPIVSEASARCVHPDYFLVLPYAFLPEFIEREKDEFWRKRGGKFIVPLPEFRVV